MMSNPFLCAFGPAIIMTLGGIVAAFHLPDFRARNCFQHFAAGVVFSAVAVELLPNVIHERARMIVVIGLTAGVALMLVLRWFAVGKASPPALTEADEGGPGVALTVGTDLAIDGLVIGISFAAGARTGIVLTLALTIEVLFLGLSASAKMIKARYSRAKLITTITAFSLILPTCAAVGAGTLGDLRGAALEIMLGLGSAALLYLVIEELFAEAQEVSETALSIALFFAGFLALLVIDLLAHR